MSNANRTVAALYAAARFFLVLQQYQVALMASTTSPASGGSLAHADGSEAPVKTSFWALTLGSIGVVYGDIGTSPLYAIRELVLAAVGPGHAASETVVLGILSLIIWALLLVVTAKYVIILLRADNNGEGGTLALMALASRALGRRVSIVILLGIMSGALFYGDAIITPALSVLSAVEGLKVATPAFDDLCCADHGCDFDRAVFGAIAWHRQDRQLLRADHIGLVCRYRRGRILAHRAKSHRAIRV